MKKILWIFFFSILYLIPTNAQSKINWLTLPQALELQKKQPRKIIIDIYTDWCGWCKTMDKETFSHPVIADFINANFYAIKFNAEAFDTVVFNGTKFTNPATGARATHQFATALFNAAKINAGYPSIAYLDEKNNLINVISGFWQAGQMEIWLNYLNENKYKPTPVEEYQKTFVSKIK